MSTDPGITHASFVDDRRKLRLELLLHNPSTRTLHLYRTMRAVRYDVDTRTLEVRLSDRGLEEPLHAGSFIRPRFTSIDPGGTTRFTVTLPRIVSRVQPGQEHAHTPLIEALPAHQAKVVEIEVAWSGTPFHDDSRPTAGGPRAQLVAWAQGHARYRLSRS